MKKICIDVRGFSEEKKKRVLDALGNLGLFWSGEKVVAYNHLNVTQYGSIYIDGSGSGSYLMYGYSEITEAQKPYLVTFKELMELANMQEHKEPEYLNDKIYTGRVKDWGLPDGSSLKEKQIGFIWGVRDGVVKPSSSLHGLGISECSSEYRLISIPEGYKLNDDGSASKIEAKHYWNGEESLDVGMLFLTSFGEFKCFERYKDQVIFINREDVPEYIHINNCKPIDTRTDKQRAIDELKSEYSKNFPFDSSDVILDMAYDKWVGKDER